MSLEPRVYSRAELDLLSARFVLNYRVTARDVMRVKYPNATDEEADHLLWEHTPYPLVSGLDDLTTRLPGLVCDCATRFET